MTLYGLVDQSVWDGDGGDGGNKSPLPPVLPGALPPALVAAATSSASLPLSILAPLLRLDPCLRVAVVVTEGEAGEADALAHTFPSRVAVVKVAAGESAAAGGIAAALRGNAVWSATSA